MKRLLVFLLILFTFFSCKKNIKVVPEISKALLNESVLTFKEGTSIIYKIMEVDSKLFLITLKGEIFKYDPGEKIVNFLYNLVTDIEPQIFHQKNIVVLRKRNADTLIIFNLQDMKIISELKDFNAGKIICVDNEIIGYLKDGQLIFFHYPSEKIVKQTKIRKNVVFFKSQIMKDKRRFLILSSRKLYVFDKIQNTLQAQNLKHKARSDFLLMEDYIYYGSANRFLVKLALSSNKVKWNFKLADRLKAKPQKAGSYIAITPEDHNIYFFNKSGTLFWWQKLESRRRLPSVVMRENVAVFLWNNTIKFFNYKKKRVISYPFTDPVYSTPIHINDFLYLISKMGDEGEISESSTNIVIKIGNNFGVEIFTNPKDILPMQKSIKCFIRNINLIEPEFKIQILNQEGTTIFRKILVHKDALTFIWIPNKAGEFKIVIEADAKNKTGIIMEKDLQIIDIDMILKNYYYKLQKRNNQFKGILRP